MSLMTKKLVGNVATVFNGTGFLAQAVISRLGKKGSQVVIAYRGSRYNDEKLRVCGGLGQIFFSKYHLKDEESLYEAMRYSNIVVNAIGRLNETRNFTFEDLYIEGPRRMARIARECGVKKFIHVSHLNANPEPMGEVLKNGSNILRTKYYGELAVKEEFPEAIIIRPSDILGESDDFLNHFTSFSRARFTRKMPLWDYYDDVEKQPVFLSDVVSGIENAIYDDTANGKIFQAVGPYRYRFYDLILYMRTCAGRGPGEEYDRCVINNLRWDFYMRGIIWFMNKVSKKPFVSWERIEMDLTSDNVDPKLPTLKDLGVELTPLEKIIEINAYYRPREHRVEIPFQSALRIDKPERLNLAA